MSHHITPDKIELLRQVTNSAIPNPHLRRVLIRCRGNLDASASILLNELASNPRVGSVPARAHAPAATAAAPHPLPSKESSDNHTQQAAVVAEGKDHVAPSAVDRPEQLSEPVMASNFITPDLRREAWRHFYIAHRDAAVRVVGADKKAVDTYIAQKWKDMGGSSRREYILQFAPPQPPQCANLSENGVNNNTNTTDTTKRTPEILIPSPECPKPIPVQHQARSHASSPAPVSSTDHKASTHIMPISVQQTDARHGTHSDTPVLSEPKPYESSNQGEGTELQTGFDNPEPKNRGLAEGKGNRYVSEVDSKKRILSTGDTKSDSPDKPLKQASPKYKLDGTSLTDIEWPRKLTSRLCRGNMLVRGGGNHSLRADDELVLEVPPIPRRVLPGGNRGKRRPGSSSTPPSPSRIVRFCKNGRELGRLAPDLGHVLAPALQSGFLTTVCKVVSPPESNRMFAEVILDITIYVNEGAFELKDDAKIEGGYDSGSGSEDQEESSGRGVDVRRINVVHLISSLKLGEPSVLHEIKSDINLAAETKNPGVVDEKNAEMYYRTVTAIDERDARSFAQSKYLISILREYQRIGVSWMISREKYGNLARMGGETLSSDFVLNPLWKKRHFPDGGSFFMNTSTGSMSLNPPPGTAGGPYGGILADEMGLGKTVQCIACIVHDVEEQQSLKESKIPVEEDCVDQHLDVGGKAKDADAGAENSEPVDEDDLTCSPDPNFCTENGDTDYLAGNERLAESKDFQIKCEENNLATSDDAFRVRRAPKRQNHNLVSAASGTSVGRENSVSWDSDGKNESNDADFLPSRSGRKVAHCDISDAKNESYTDSIEIEHLDRPAKRVRNEVLVLSHRANTASPFFYEGNDIRRDQDHAKEGYDEDHVDDDDDDFSCNDDCARNAQNINERSDEGPDISRFGSRPIQQAIEKKSAINVLMNNTGNGSNKGGTLIVCPTSLVTQWMNELELHVAPQFLRVVSHYGQTRGDKRSICKSAADVVITTYGILASEFVEDGKDRSQRHTNTCGPVFQIEWRRVILDEAHTIKSRVTRWAKAAYNIKADRRWCVTGTVIHNHVNDVFSLLHFLQLKPWSSWAFWNRGIVNNLESRDLSSQKAAMSLIRDIISSVTLRRRKTTLDSSGKPIVNLTKKTVEMVTLKPSPEEWDFYVALENQSKLKFDTFLAQGKVMNNYASVLELLLRLRQACDHPFLVFAAAPSKDSQLLKDKDKMYKAFMDGRSSSQYVENILKNAENGKSQDCPVCLDIIEDAVAPRECGHPACRGCLESLLRRSSKCPICRVQICAESITTLPRDSRFSVDLDKKWRSSVKIDTLLAEISDREQRRKKSHMSIGKSVIFSQFTSMLDLVQHALTKEGFLSMRIDGSVPQSKRADVLSKFDSDNELDDSVANVLLVSLRAGGVGLNLVSASHAILLDIHWNPQVDAQAQDRIHRHGQSRDVIIRRYLIKDSVEERLLKVQSRKQDVADGALGVATEEDKKKARMSELKLLFAS